MKKFFPVFMAIFLLGCMDKNPPSKPLKIKKTYPSWYLNPPQSKNFVYVTGSGIDKESAVLNALNNFIAKYNITISSKTETKKEAFNGNLYNQRSVQNINASVNKIEISNYEIQKVYQYSFDKVLVLVKIDKNALFNNLKNRLDNRFLEYKNEFKILLKDNPLKEYLGLKELYAKLKKEKKYIYFLKALNNRFDEKAYENFVNRVYKKLIFLKNNLAVKINSSNPEISEDIKKYLTKKGIKIGESDLKLNVKVKKKRENYMNLAVYYIYLQTEYKGKIVGSNFFKIIIPSTSHLNGYLFEEIKNLPLKEFFNLS